MSRPGKTVTTKEEFVERVYELRRDLVAGESYWQNVTLEEYLGALAFWVEDRMTEMYARHGLNVPEEGSDTWQVLSDLLLIAAIYE